MFDGILLRGEATLIEPRPRGVSGAIASMSSSRDKPQTCAKCATHSFSGVCGDMDAAPSPAAASTTSIWLASRNSHVSISTRRQRSSEVCMEVSVASRLRSTLSKHKSRFTMSLHARLARNFAHFLRTCSASFDFAAEAACTSWLRMRSRRCSQAERSSQRCCKRGQFTLLPEPEPRCGMRATAGCGLDTLFSSARSLRGVRAEGWAMSREDCAGARCATVTAGERALGDASLWHR
mmetsp:Transcript_54266/g.116548  ORF Transcript_54266/g.116548 Transcript_54266/m.116548 type:complete len:236 (+) Transcript_54266:65-772(+)